jgi:hypothetical protein
VVNFLHSGGNLWLGSIFISAGVSFTQSGTDEHLKFGQPNEDNAPEVLDMRKKKSKTTQASHPAKAPSKKRGTRRATDAAKLAQLAVECYCKLQQAGGSFEDSLGRQRSISKPTLRLSPAGQKTFAESAQKNGIEARDLIKKVRLVHVHFLRTINQDVDQACKNDEWTLPADLLSEWQQSKQSKELLSAANWPNSSGALVERKLIPKAEKHDSRFQTRSAKYISIHEYLSSIEECVVPDYQRTYVWKRENVQNLFDDLDQLSLLKSDSEIRFLGTILTQRDPASEAVEILDGQQRTLTFSLVVCVAAKLLLESGSVRMAEELVKRYLGRDLGSHFMPKFIPGPQDQPAYKEALLAATDDRFETGTWRFPTGWSAEEPRGNVPDVIDAIEERLDAGSGGSIEDQKSAMLERLYRLLYCCAICRFRLAAEDDALETFIRLNSRGTPLQPCDLVKSALFAGSLEGEDEERIKKSWDHLTARVAGPDSSDTQRRRLDSFFTSYAKVELGRVTKRRTVSKLETYWQGKPREDISQSLLRWGSLFNATTSFATLGKECSAAIEKLDAAEQGWLWILSTLTPSEEVIPFVMRLLELRLRTKPQVNKKRCVDALEFLASWSIRHLLITGRSLQGLQTLMTDATIALRDDPKTEAREILCSHLDTNDQRLGDLTDDRFRASLLRSGLAKRREITRALLYRLDCDQRPFSQESDRKKSSRLNDIHIEHVCPQKLPGATEWTGFWNADAHGSFKDCLGNVVLLEKKINETIQRESFEKKTSVYLEFSQLSVTRKLRTEVTEDPRWTSSWTGQWGPQLVEDRTKDLADRLVQLFPFDAARMKHRSP